MNYIRSGHRVEAAEQAAMARLRELEADWRMLKRTAREAMTPGRVVGAGLATGFVLGRAGAIDGAGGLGRILSASVAMLNFAASRQAHEAAGEAELAAAETASVATEYGERLKCDGEGIGPSKAAPAGDSEAAD